MPNVIQTNISAGKIGQKIRGRIDNPKYLNGLDECKNFIPFIQGGGTRRPGTMRIADSSVSWITNNNAQLVGLNIDDSEDYYFLELASSSIRVLRSKTNPITASGAYASSTTEKADIVASIVSPYTDDDIPDVYINPIGRNEVYFTHPNHAPRVLDTTLWALSVVPWTCHPFTTLDDTDTALKVTNESEIVALTSDTSENWATAHTAASNDFDANTTYIEYKVDNEWFLGRCLDTNTTPSAPDPTATKIYVDPVEAVVIGLDPSARMAYVDSTDLDADTDEFRSDTLVFNYDMIGAYIRITSDYEDLRDTSFADGNVYWGQVAEYTGGKDIPTRFHIGTGIAAGTADNPGGDFFKTGGTYKMRTAGTLDVTVGAPIDTTTSTNTHIWGDGFIYTRDDDVFVWAHGARVNTASSAATIVDDLGSLKTFDVVEVNSPIYAAAGATSDQKLLQPTGNITVLDRLTDPDGNAEHSATVTASRGDTFRAATTWATTTAYSLGDYRYDAVGGRSYDCIVAHTSDGTAFANDKALGYWKARDYNDRYLQLQFRNDWVTALITTVTSDTVVQVELLGPVPRATNSLDPTAFVNDGQTTTWRMSSWGYEDYPYTITFYEQRIILGGNPSNPHYFWASKLKDNFDFRIIEDNGEVLDTTGITYPLSSTDLAAIQWMLPGPTLVIGTAQKEWQVKPNSFGQALTQENIRITSETEIGSERKAIRAGSSIFFIERGGRGFRELYFDFSVDGFRSRDLMTLADDILGDETIIDFAYQKFPNQIFWVVTSGGKLKSFTYDAENNFYSWADHGITSCLAIGSAPRTGANFSEDAVWLTTSINGSVNGFGTVQALTTTFKELDTPDGYNGKMMFLDNANWYSEDNGDTVTACTSITGLTWLQGVAVDVVVDGVYYGQVTVSILGVLTLPVTAERNIAFGFMSTNNVEIVTLPHASAGVAGPNWGRLKRFRKVYVYLVESLGGLVDDNTGLTPEEIQYLDQETLVHGQTPLLQTGFKDLDFEWESDVDPRVRITTDKPYPLTILSLAYELESNE